MINFLAKADKDFLRLRRLEQVALVESFASVTSILPRASIVNQQSDLSGVDGPLLRSYGAKAWGSAMLAGNLQCEDNHG